MLMHSSETEDAIPVKSVPLSLESMDLSAYLLTTWESAKCLKTAARQIKTSVGQSIGKHIQREDLTQQNYTKVYFQDEFLISAIFGTNYLSAFYGKQTRKEKISSLPSIVYNLKKGQ